MTKALGPEDRRLDGAYPATAISVSALFTVLWDALADLLGTAATAALLKRGARRAAARSPELAELIVQRDGLSYSYAVPASWSKTSRSGLAALRDLIVELRPLLIEMTGQLVIRHLEELPALRMHGLLEPEKEPR